LEKPLFYDNDIFGFNRYANVRYKFKEKCFLLRGNLTVDHENLIKVGLNGIRKIINDHYQEGGSSQKFYDYCIRILDDLSDIVDKYRECAKERKNQELYEALCVVPENGAKTYYQALVSIKFLHYVLRLSDAVHLGLGRMDVYLKELYEQDLAKGVTIEELLEITELFFISLNLDTDLYDGVQQGDNGQSLMLGGVTKDGKESYSALTDLILKACEELCLIDPKINVRVNKNTPLEFYTRLTKLTKLGLGFPQYCNDDVVIPGLVALGYKEEDARDYTVAACWEIVIPGIGAEIPNLTTMNFPLIIEKSLSKHLLDCDTFEIFLGKVKYELEREADRLINGVNCLSLRANPFLSVFITPCLYSGKDIANGGAIYNNFGMHGAGISTAVDSLFAIKKACFEDKSIEKNVLLQALKNNYKGFEDLQRQLLSYPKMGDNIDEVDDIAHYLMEIFSAYVNGKPNQRGGIHRAGTGSAMEYIFSAEKVGATPDGRNAKTAYASSFSPSLNARLNGPLSVIYSFTKFDMKNIINGGPLTLEIHDSVFRNEQGEKKVAMLVKSFIDRGGHQLQLNAINREKLIDAQKHPEKYPNLVVRVWGWSGYFAELDLSYQNHIIMRTHFLA
ncbi:MAG: pyruvate formate-lyase, partial [Clostridia bacterium]|nr:pyruvate formate-lyase [Clostridia bacterium]